MKRLILSISIMLSVFGAVSAQQQTTSFSYQGKLNVGALPANAVYDFRFELHKDLIVSNLVGTAEINAVQVTNGIFTVQLDFGTEAFADGGDRFLDISLKPSGAPTYVRLSPRQKINSVPYATRSLNSQTADFAATAQNATNANGLGGLPSSSFLLVNGDGSQLTNVIGAIRWQEITANTQALPNRGYIVGADGEVEVRLPANPQVGDVVRVVQSGGAGNFFIKLNSGQTVARADDGLNRAWTARGPDGMIWESIASSADGTKLVAAGVDPTFARQIYTSTDSGLTWVLRYSDVLSGSFRAAASSADGTKLFVLRGGNFALVSYDSGLTWTQRVISENQSFVSIAVSADGGKLAAVGNNGYVHTSSDSGVTWIAREGSGIMSWSSITSSADGTRLAAAGINLNTLSPERIFVSTDSGATWAPSGSPAVLGWGSVASSADGSKLYAVSPNMPIYASSDFGATWSSRETNRTWRKIISSPSGKVLMAIYGGTSERWLMTSTDWGETWVQQDGPRPWTDIASSADGSRQFATGGYIFVKPSNTLSVGLRGSGAVELLYVGNGKFSILSSTGTIGYF